jgi:hypothetical protein
MRTIDGWNPRWQHDRLQYSASALGPLMLERFIRRMVDALDKCVSSLSIPSTGRTHSVN